MGRPIHFEIQADDVERAKGFYGAVFGWSFQDWSTASGGGTYWGVVTGEEGKPGINGGLLQRATSAPLPEQGANAWVVTMLVDDYDATHQLILSAGGSVALPKTALTGMAWQGYYLDTEGNTFGIHQPDPEAR